MSREHYNLPPHENSTDTESESTSPHPVFKPLLVRRNACMLRLPTRDYVPQKRKHSEDEDDNDYNAYDVSTYAVKRPDASYHKSSNILPMSINPIPSLSKCLPSPTYYESGSDDDSSTPLGPDMKSLCIALQRLLSCHKKHIGPIPKHIEYMHFLGRDDIDSAGILGKDLEEPDQC